MNGYCRNWSNCRSMTGHTGSLEQTSMLAAAKAESRLSVSTSRGMVIIGNAKSAQEGIVRQASANHLG